MIGKLAELGTAKASRRNEEIRAKKSGNAFACGIKDFDSTSLWHLNENTGGVSKISNPSETPGKYINIHCDYGYCAKQ